jgi:hypothetical protein
MATQLNIKDAETVALAHLVARQRGTTVTRAIRDALRNVELPPAETAPLTPEQRTAFEAVMAIARRTAPRARAAGITMANYDDGTFDYLYGSDAKR